MKNIVLKIPTFFFLLGVFLPLIARYLSKEFIEYKSLADSTILSTIQILTFWIWTCSVLAYFSSEAKEYKNNRLIYSLISLTCLLSLFGDLILSDWLILLIGLINHIVIVVFLTKRIRQVFYARSKWFIAVEVFIPVIGFLTLTPEVKRWEKSEKS